jgi:hypothetical protein
MAAFLFGEFMRLHLLHREAYGIRTALAKSECRVTQYAVCNAVITLKECLLRGTN